MDPIVLRRVWPDNERLEVKVPVDDTHPDGLLHEAARIALELFTQAHAVILLSEAVDLDDE